MATTYTIHLYTDDRTVKPYFYIGCTRHIKKRIRDHKNELRTNKHFNSRMQEKFNQGYTIVIFETFEFDTREEAYEREQELIKKNLGNPYMLNVLVGNDSFTHCPNKEERVRVIVRNLRKHYSENPSPHLGVPKSPEHRAKISAHAKTRTGEKNSFWGRTHSAKTKKMLSEAHRGKIPPNRIPVRIHGVEYASYGCASKALGVPVVTVRHRVLNENPKFKDWVAVNVQRLSKA